MILYIQSVKNIIKSEVDELVSKINCNQVIFDYSTIKNRNIYKYDILKMQFTITCELSEYLLKYRKIRRGV